MELPILLSNFTWNEKRGAMLTYNTGCTSANLSDHLVEGNLLSLFSIILSVILRIPIEMD